MDLKDIEFKKLTSEQQFMFMTGWVDELVQIVEDLKNCSKNAGKRQSAKIQATINIATELILILKIKLAECRITMIRACIGVSSAPGERITTKNRKQFEMEILGGAPCLTDREARKYSSSDEEEKEKPVSTIFNDSNYTGQAIPGFSEKQNTAFREYLRGVKIDKIADTARVQVMTVRGWLARLKKQYPDLGKSLRTQRFVNRRA